MIFAEPVLTTVDSFTVSGLTVRTSNKAEFNQETAQIPTLWQNFSPIPNTAIYGVYADYESDATGFYSVTVGQKMETSGLNIVQIAAGNYLIFSGRGAMPQVVIEIWATIWSYFESSMIHERQYKTDFELYTDAEGVAVYIGVK